MKGIVRQDEVFDNTSFCYGKHRPSYPCLGHTQVCHQPFLPCQEYYWELGGYDPEIRYYGDLTAPLEADQCPSLPGILVHCESQVLSTWRCPFGFGCAVEPWRLGCSSWWVWFSQLSFLAKQWNIYVSDSYLEWWRLWLRWILGYDNR